MYLRLILYLEQSGLTLMKIVSDLETGYVFNKWEGSG